MERNSNEKPLTVVNEKSFFYKIKSFFSKLFGKKEINKEQHIVNSIENVEVKNNVSNIEDNGVEANNKKYEFMESIKSIENEETELLKLQEQYDKRLIETDDIPEDKIDALIDLYKKQIKELIKNNGIKKERILQYKRV